MADYSFIGVGNLNLGLLSNGVLTTPGLVPIGNVGKLSLSVAEDVKELQDYTSSGGGLKNKIYRIKSCDLDSEVYDLSPSNIGIALRGSSTAVTSAAVATEDAVAYKGGLVVPAFMYDSTVTPVLKDSTGTTTYSATTDYNLEPAGFRILSTGTIVDGSTIKLAYTKAASHMVETLTASGNEYKVVFSGLNDARTGKKVTAIIYRVKFSPSSLDLISTDFTKLSLKGSVLRDTNITGTGISQYLRIILED